MMTVAILLTIAVAAYLTGFEFISFILMFAASVFAWIEVAQP